MPAAAAGPRGSTRATITPVGSNLNIEGQVWQVSPVIDPDTRQGMVRIAVGLDDVEDLKSDLLRGLNSL